MSWGRLIRGHGPLLQVALVYVFCKGNLLVFMGESTLAPVSELHLTYGVGVGRARDNTSMVNREKADLFLFYLSRVGGSGVTSAIILLKRLC